MFELLLKRKTIATQGQTRTDSLLKTCGDMSRNARIGENGRNGN